MDPDIHFGEVEHTPTTTRLRPDRNGQLAVATVRSPEAEDLPVFVDLDVMREMLTHAHSDKRVELGGVLLGGQFEDEHGRPFVLITDCLRARHYESTKGSFKFTHETWEQITREREQFPAAVQMVGWYHTHPDWGVFLSGLDMFICDNFFNKPLDVALVIDPCQRDTGFFQWTGQPQERIRRTGGYMLFASRFRADELRDLAAELEGQIMPESARSAQTPFTVHMPPPPPPPPVWQSLAVFGMLGLQFCLLMLLAVRLLPTASGEPPVAARELTALKESIDRLDLVRQREADVDAKLQVLEMVVRQTGQAPEGILKSFAERTSEVEQLRGSLRGQQSLAKELDRKILGLEAAVAEVRQTEEHSRAEVANLQTKIGELDEELLAARDQRTHPPGSSRQPASDQELSWWKMWTADGKSLSFGALLGATVVGATLLAMMRRHPASEPRPERSQ